MIKTMAVQINEKTYPIVVAILGGSFAAIKKADVFGSFVVINDLRPYHWSPAYFENQAVRCDDEDDSPRPYNQIRRARMNDDLGLRNYMIAKKVFKKEFDVADLLKSGLYPEDQFFEITRK